MTQQVSLFAPNPNVNAWGIALCRAALDRARRSGEYPQTRGAR